MKKSAKRFFILVALVVLLSAVAWWLASSADGPLYRSESLVRVTPYAKALDGTAFEANFIRANPSVIRLQGSAAAGSVVLRIVAIGSTAQDAEGAATQAAQQACRAVLSNYGVKGVILENASSARSYSYFYDKFLPFLSRLR